MSDTAKIIRLRMPDGDYHTAYLELADHPHQIVDCVKRTVWLDELIPDYDGPSLTIEFNENGRAIGIEILYPHDDDR